MVKFLGRAKARLHFSLFTLHFSLKCGCGGIGSLESERARWAMKRARQGAATTSITSAERVRRLCCKPYRAKQKNQQTKFNSRVWRNWQLGERARPVGDEASSTRRSNNEYRECERVRRLCCKPYRAKQQNSRQILFAGVAELADAQDLGSCVNSCRFKSCHPHHVKRS